MKRFSLRTFLFAAGLTAILTVSAGAASLGTATVNASALRLRAGADTGSAVLSMAYKGDKVEVLEDAGNGWYKVSLKGVTGYMSGEYLTLSGTTAPAQTTVVADQTVPTAASPAQGSVKVNLSAGEVLNLRSGPSTQNAKVSAIPGGTVLTVEESVNGWYKVTYNGKTGYVSASYVTSTEQTAATSTAAVSYDSSFGSSVVALAKQYIGCPYVYGASGPRSFDCSGFTSFIYKQMGVSIPRGASGQYNSGTAVSRENLQPGDLVFIADPAYTAGYPVSHVGIYIGNGQFIHASSYRGEGITISSLFTGRYGTYYAGARRFV